MNEKNVDIYALGPNGPMLFWKIQADEYDGAQALLNAGADINVRGFSAETPAISAATADDWKGVLYLANCGADLSLYGANGFTVANMAKGSRLRLDSEQGGYLEKVRGILDDRGLYDNVLTSKQLRDQMAAGKIPTPQGFNRNNWPPRK